MLEELVKAAKAQGLMGVAVWDQGGPDGKCAGLLDRNARLSNSTAHKSWDSHPTFEEALADLARQMGLDPATLTSKV